MSDWMDGPEDKQVLGERCLLMGVLEQLVLALSVSQYSNGGITGAWEINNRYRRNRVGEKIMENEIQKCTGKLNFYDWSNSSAPHT